MRVLIVGGGGREHALAWKIAQSPMVDAMFAAPGNPGIARHASCVDIAVDAHDDLVSFARRERIDLTVVGPEVPLVAGLADRLTAAGLTVFGPSARAAALEGSKVFSKDLMSRAGVPTARFASFDQPAAARGYCREVGAPLVVKADGLAAGKGAIVCRSLEEADAAIAECMERRAFGLSGARVVVEEFMVGQEVSFFVLANGIDALPLAAAEDHKTVFDGDRGPNTGGMGCYSPVPSFDDGVEKRVMETIVRPTLAALVREGAPYRGVLYVGLMLTAEGPKVIEYNCRFGDPECQALVVRAPGPGSVAPCRREGRRVAAAGVVASAGVGLRVRRVRGIPGQVPDRTADPRRRRRRSPAWRAGVPRGHRDAGGAAGHRGRAGPGRDRLRRHARARDRHRLRGDRRDLVRRDALSYGYRTEDDTNRIVLGALGRRGRRRP